MKKSILLFFLIIDTIVIDILTKYWVNNADPHFPVLGNFLRIDHVKNTGIAFGTQLPGISWIIPIVLLCIAVFFTRNWKTLSEIEKVGYLFIITGGLLNAGERAFFGSVTDFISVQYFSVFNVADIAITLGVVLLLVGAFKAKKD